MSDLLKIHEIRLLNARKIMKDSGLDRTQFAEKIGMSYNLLSQYIGKNPKKNIGDDTAEKIENAFNKRSTHSFFKSETESDCIIFLQEPIICL